VPKSYDAAFPLTIDLNKKYTATLETARGTVVVQLHAKAAPLSVNNFVSLAREGYYDGLTFHRVEDWVVQGGCPRGDGRGGPGYRFPDEPVQGEYSVGSLSMANSGPNTNGSQFFFLTKDMSGRLPKNYNRFGDVTSGIEAIHAMRPNDAITSITIAESD
jgi:cyclophilin family peptidyl-prolyl cis-trans isomerase